jgi:hypothetical protein
MAVTQNQYTSEYGWVITPPPDWAPLPQPAEPVLAPHLPVVFSCEDDPDLSLTWMIAGHPVQEEVARKYLSVTAAERPALADLMDIAAKVFPFIGKADSCEVVKLADGSRAIEVTETYLEDGERKNGYQMILPVGDTSNCPSRFQRLCFYAPAAKFGAALPAVRAAARSFHYTPA